MKKTELKEDVPTQKEMKTKWIIQNKQKELEARLAGTQQTIKIKLLGRKAFDDYKKEDYKTINGDYDGKNK